MTEPEPEPARRRLGRPPDSDSNETRERLLAGARRAFATYGFEATTNREIADAADVTPGAIYHYFDSKAELYAAVYAEVQAISQAALFRAIEGQRGLVPSMVAALDAVVELNASDPSISGFLVTTATDLRRHHELCEVLGPEIGRTTMLLHASAREAQANGELHADLDLRAMEDLLNIVLLGLARFSLEQGDARRHDAVVGLLKRLLAGEVLRPST